MNNPITSRSTATEAQIQRVLAMLKTAPRHTHELRASGVSHPAARVMDLRKRGYHITVHRVTTIDSDGFSHVGVARYALVTAAEETAVEAERSAAA